MNDVLRLIKIRLHLYHDWSKIKELLIKQYILVKFTTLQNERQ